MREVSSNRDQADFGLGDAQTDAENLDRIHNELTSQDWTLVQDFAGTQYPTTIAVADYKGRMMYSSAAPGHGRSDLTQLPWVKTALTQQGPHDHAWSAPTIRAGRHRPARRGAAAGGSASSTPARSCSATTRPRRSPARSSRRSTPRELFGEIRLDEQTRLSIVAPDGTAIGDVPAALVKVAAAHHRDRRGRRSAARLPGAGAADPRVRQPGRRQRRDGAPARQRAASLFPGRAPGVRAGDGRRHRGGDRVRRCEPARSPAPDAGDGVPFRLRAPRQRGRFPTQPRRTMAYKAALRHTKWHSLGAARSGQRRRPSQRLPRRQNCSLAIIPERELLEPSARVSGARLCALRSTSGFAMYAPDRYRSCTNWR